jgi:hypothetical protein
METYSIRTSDRTIVLPKSDLALARQRAAAYAQQYDQTIDFCRHTDTPGCTIIIPHADGYTEVAGNGAHIRYYDYQRGAVKGEPMQ